MKTDNKYKFKISYINGQSQEIHSAATLFEAWVALFFSAKFGIASIKSIERIDI